MSYLLFNLYIVLYLIELVILHDVLPTHAGLHEIYDITYLCNDTIYVSYLNMHPRMLELFDLFYALLISYAMALFHLYTLCIDLCTVRR